ncbi:MAG: hypothetical protein ICV73_21895 [Acetobacteraceae bacterium]|nr:hypothetical protein [Acetobacteraceae bacterium]
MLRSVPSRLRPLAVVAAVGAAPALPSAAQARTFFSFGFGFPGFYAGAYVCPADRPGPAGAPCSCPTNTGRARGRIG